MFRGRCVSEKCLLLFFSLAGCEEPTHPTHTHAMLQVVRVCASNQQEEEGGRKQGRQGRNSKKKKKTTSHRGRIEWRAQNTAKTN
jgi:hypothetical protein